MDAALAKVGNINQAIINLKKNNFTDMLFLYPCFITDTFSISSGQMEQFLIL